ncbi:ATP-binding cassette domain-containing protein [Streptomyces sp. NPDC006649]|uniref:ABC transporter ATP-binding protein n=1 Tax=Streptomyces sp. NPDC006649 TaxID=3156896 RepID=UPI0033A3C4F9
MTSIEVSELTKDYGSNRAVDGLSFTVLPGRVTGFLGPNGAGKSTTMRLVLGLDRPTSGAAAIGGRRYAHAAEPLRLAGALLDANAAHGARTARDHLLALAAAHRMGRGRVAEVLEDAGIASVAAHRIRTFSLGMRQRLGIAAALLGDPSVLMLDEPSNGLDPEGIIWIRELMRRLAAEGRTVLVSSHLMNETASFADHLVVLGKGRLLANTPMQDFIDSRIRPRVRLRSPEGERLRSLLFRKGLVPVERGDGSWAVESARAEEIGSIAAEEDITIYELATGQATLEEAYLDLTVGEAQFSARPPSLAPEV